MICIAISENIIVKLYLLCCDIKESVFKYRKPCWKVAG